MNKIIVHISEVEIIREGGMGRVEYYWRDAFERNGYTFVHIGPKEVGPLLHRFFFPYKAYRYYTNLNITADAFIVHEPASGCFVNKGVPCFVESHGVERRYWDLTLNNSNYGNKIQLKTKLFHSILRLYNCDKGIRHADKLLLINNDDKDYVINKYERQNEDIFLFHNGINSLYNNVVKFNPFTILFNGSWVVRKGIKTLVQSAEILFLNNIIVNYLLVGTGKSEAEVLQDWPAYLHPHVTVVSHFHQDKEAEFLDQCSIFVLPSFYEGQPLSLLQAMAAGKCCITTNCCGQKDIIEMRKNGLLFNPGDFNELYKLISECYNNHRLVTVIGINAKDYTRSISWENVSNELFNFITNNI